MIVVADASPLNYLVWIGCEQILIDLYSEVLVPRIVVEELLATGAPARVRAWATETPDWVKIQTSIILSESIPLNLDLGESMAISLALEVKANVVLIDERRATIVARRLGLQVTGTLGILRDAHYAGRLDARLAVKRLIEETNFRVSARVSDLFLSSLSH